MRSCVNLAAGSALAPYKSLLVLPLFFLSGAAALIYEVLWMKELGLLFGNIAYAVATTLAAFFLGMAAGSEVLGKISVRLEEPLRVYAWLEFSVAVCAMGYFLILAGYRWVYPWLFDRFGAEAALFTAVKFLLAVIILFPPTFFMGGTLPVMSQFLVRHRAQLGSKVSLLYLVNTLGAAAGAFLAGFYLPLALGFKNTFFLAMAITLSVAFAALLLARGERSPAYAAGEGALPAMTPEYAGRRDAAAKGDATLIPAMRQLRGFALLSGAVTLALQVLWTRMFAQVLQNSVYTFAILLVVFLLFLALGAFVANRLMASRLDPVTALFILLTGGAMLVAATPFVFDAWTEGLHYIDSNRGWGDYVLRVFGLAFAIMGPPLLLLGAVFPSLMKLAEPHGGSAGRLVGQLAALNTVGAIGGSLVAGFFILDFIGLWAGIRLAATVYLLAALCLIYQQRSDHPRWLLIPFAGILLLVSFLDTSRLPVVRIDPLIDEESLLEAWEESAGTVAVIRRGEHLNIKVNNYYTLGGTASYELEQLEGYLPVLLHPNPRSIYLIGLGTGITAGAALKFPIRRLVVTELLPAVVTASDKYFARWNNGLFLDPRAQVLREDGRNYLYGTRETFDVITGDLFVPWQAGTGSLYTVEHFRAVRNRLSDGGLFMQWLPAYQLSWHEFAVIAKTLLEVFPQVTVWRGDFSATRPIVGLLAQKGISPLAEDTLLFTHEAAREGEERAPLLTHYVGNLSAAGRVLADFPVNTDDRPVVEFLAPISQRLNKAGRIDWLAGEELLHFMEALQKGVPAENDPYLSALSEGKRTLPAAGLHLHKGQLLKQQGKLSAAETEFERYRQLTAQAP